MIIFPQELKRREQTRVFDKLTHLFASMFINSNVIFDKARMMEGEDSLFILLIHDDVYYFLSNRMSINIV